MSDRMFIKLPATGAVGACTRHQFDNLWSKRGFVEATVDEYEQQVKDHAAQRSGVTTESPEAAALPSLTTTGPPEGPADGDQSPDT